MNEKSYYEEKKHIYDHLKTQYSELDTSTIGNVEADPLEYCCHPIVDEVIIMIGYIIKSLHEYRHYDDNIIYRILITIIYGLHYLEQSTDRFILDIDRLDPLYLNLSIYDIYINGQNLSSYVRQFFLYYDPYKWDDDNWQRLEDIIQLYLQVITDESSYLPIRRIYTADTTNAETKDKIDGIFKFSMEFGGYKKKNTRKRSKRKIKKSVRTNETNRVRLEKFR